MTFNSFVLPKARIQCGLNACKTLNFLRQKECVSHLFVESKNVLHADLKSVSVPRPHAVQLVASFGVKPQLCQLQLKTTHGPKQDIKKKFTAP